MPKQVSDNITIKSETVSTIVCESRGEQDEKYLDADRAHEVFLSEGWRAIGDMTLCSDCAYLKLNQ